MILVNLLHFFPQSFQKYKQLLLTVVYIADLMAAKYFC